MNRMLHHTSVVLTITLFSVLLAVGTVDRSQVSAADAGPALTDVSALASSPGTISVSGATFTPGGAVYVALYDPWGAALHETRWITASQTVYGPRGSTDPALGYRQGGTVRETFDGLCGSTVMVRAFDQETAMWSNWMNVDSTGTDSALYAEVGRPDPALTHLPAC